MPRTNHSELLDRAVWRRFQVRLEVPAPSVADRNRFASILVDRLRLRPVDSIDRIIRRLGAASFSEIEEFFLELRRRQVLSQEDKKTDKLILRETLAADDLEPVARDGRPTRPLRATRLPDSDFPFLVF